MQHYTTLPIPHLPVYCVSLYNWSWTIQWNTHCNNTGSWYVSCRHIQILASYTDYGFGNNLSYLGILFLLSVAPDSPPQNFTADVLNSTAVFLQWSPPTLDQQNGVIRKYHIRQSETVTGILTNYSREGNYTELLIGSLHAYYQYQFTIAAETVEQGPFSNPVTVTTLEAGEQPLL